MVRLSALPPVDNASPTRISTALLLAGLCASLPQTLWADTPAGWISSDNPSAYTTTRGRLELTAALLGVNEDLDVLNIRDDVVAQSNRLAGDSGDLVGRKFALHYGITEELEVFAHFQSHALSVELGDIASVNLIDIDNSLDTEQYAAGFKWTIYRGLLNNPNNRHAALSLEAEVFQNESDDFDVVIDELSFAGADIFFRDPQTFSVRDLEDEGWRARLLYSRPWWGSATLSAWLGYGEGESTSATGSDLGSVTIARFFEQSFRREEDYYLAGLSLNWFVMPRLPLQLSYEYIRLSDARLSREPLTPPIQLPGFLAASGAPGVDENQRFTGRIAWWLTPRVSVAAVANVTSRQFTGRIPHYNNPLSESFTALLYGYAGLELRLGL